MIYLINILIVSLVSFLTLSFLPYFKIFGIVPILPIGLFLIFAKYRKGTECFILASFSGMFFDLYSPQPFGFYLILYTLTVLIVKSLYKEGYSNLPFGYFLGLSLLVLVLYYLSQPLVLLARGHEIHIENLILIPVAIIVNLLFFSILYWPLSRFFEWQYEIESKLKRR